MTSMFEWLATVIDAAIDFIGRIAAWVTFVLVLVMATNVLLRYLFATGTVWAQELEWHLMVPICLFGMSYALRHGEHVRVDVLYARFAPRRKLAVEILSATIAVTISILIIKLSWNYVLQAWSVDEGSANPGGIPHRYVLKAIIPIGFALFGAQSLAVGLRALVALRGAR